MQPFRYTLGERLGITLLLSVVAALVVGAGLLARRHLQSGRGDRRGAFRVATFAFVTGLLAWAVGADHVADQKDEFGLIFMGIGYSLVVPCVLWIFYLALEPYARRVWPQTLISWTRLLGGGWNDGRVGSDALVGATWGTLLACLFVFSLDLPRLVGLAPMAPSFGPSLETLLGLRYAVAFALGLANGSVLITMGSMLVLILARLAFKHVWLAGLVFAIVQTVPRVLTSTLPTWLALPVALLIAAGFTLLVLRYGLLAGVVGAYVTDLLLASPALGNLSGWAAIGTVFPAAVVGSLALHAFRAASARR